MDDGYNHMNQQNYNYGEYHQEPDLEPVMSVGQWLITSLIMSIPCINIVMLFVWGFGDGNRNRANYCKASLILWIIGLALSFLVMALAGVGATLGLSSV